jgi:hypothetical protein
MKLLGDPEIPTSRRSLGENTPLPQVSRRCRRDGAEAGDTLLEMTSSPPPNPPNQNPKTN